MGYEYDFVFDWMVKKPSPQTALKGSGEEKEDSAKGGNGDADMA